MNYLLTLHRRIEWQHLFPFLVIVGVEMIVLRTLSGTPAAMSIRYSTFLLVVFLTVWLARHHIIRPIQEIKQTSLRIAAGNYRERLPSYQSSIELTELANAFNQMAEALETTEQRRIDLIGNVAHELRSPLSNIKATMEGLIDNVLEPEPALFFTIQSEVNRLQRLVQQLELLSRAESGQIPLKQERLDLNRLIEQICNQLAIQYADKGVALAYKPTNRLPPVQGDGDRVKQILINLLGNALQYTPAGGSVTVAALYEQPWIKVQVADTGIGIPPAQLTQIFERFYRVDPSRSRSSGGAGIGLTIAKHLVYAHGGEIWATSEGVGCGATFAFTLPAAPLDN
ncbi:MAG: HAMP domain-containing sensor histidine kinase [Caldilineaceae bacterium]